MAVNINVPSQVKTYANLAAFPATGALKTIYIAEDTNKTYRWTGSVYTEISASAAMTWGAIGGTLSNQTDLQNALDAKQDDITLTTTGSSGASTLVGATINVPNYTLSGLGGVPTSRTLTINGVTQDLSADRTFTISTGITIGSTAITSGTVGRILFEGTGNVVQESSSLFWDNTNARLGIGTSSPSSKLHVIGNALFDGVATFTGLYPYFELKPSGWGTNYFYLQAGVNISGANAGSYTAFFNYLGTARGFTFIQGSNNTLTLTPTTYNVLINTTTDAGYRLDVNGTARATKVVVGASTASPYQLNVWGGAVESYISLNNTNSGNLNTDGFQIGLEANGTDVYFINRENGFIQFRTNNLDRLRIFSTGNVGINTTTDVASAQLNVESTTKGFLPPRMTTTQKNAIATPAAGLIVYDTTLNKLCVYTTAWETVTSL